MALFLHGEDAFDQRGREKGAESLDLAQHPGKIGQQRPAAEQQGGGLVPVDSGRDLEIAQLPVREAGDGEKTGGQLAVLGWGERGRGRPVHHHLASFGRGLGRHGPGDGLAQQDVFHPSGGTDRQGRISPAADADFHLERDGPQRRLDGAKGGHLPHHAQPGPHGPACVLVLVLGLLRKGDQQGVPGEFEQDTAGPGEYLDHRLKIAVDHLGQPFRPFPALARQALREGGKAAHVGKEAGAAGGLAMDPAGFRPADRLLGQVGGEIGGEQVANRAQARGRLEGCSPPGIAGRQLAPEIRWQVILQARV